MCVCVYKYNIYSTKKSLIPKEHLLSIGLKKSKNTH